MIKKANNVCLIFPMFSMSEKLCLQWNDFKENIISSVGNLREDQEFTDVTLACEDGRRIEAHKIILAGSSPFFDNLLKRNKHSHPLVYMKGMKSEDMAAIVNFLYRGEANVFQESLESFLAIALKSLSSKVSPAKKLLKWQKTMRSGDLLIDYWTH